MYLLAIENLCDQPENFEMQSVRGEALQNKLRLQGFVYLLMRGNAMLVSKSMSTFYISLKQVAENNLKTGDIVEAGIDGKTVTEIASVEKNNFDYAKYIRPHRLCVINDTSFKFGDKVVFASQKPLDFVEFIGMHGSKNQNVYKVALLIDQGEDCVGYLAKQGIDEVYLADVKQTLKNKVLFTLASSFAAKKQALKGKDVILFIDNLNKLFKLYNSSIADFEGQIDVTKLRHGALVDLKTFFMQARQLEVGSLTIISYLRKPATELEKYVMDDFVDLSTVYREIT
jgi:transcription termination factor Rho